MKLLASFIVILAVIISIQSQIIRSPNKVAGSYLVTLQADKDADLTAKDLVKKHGGKIKHVYKSALKGFNFQGDESAAEKISHDPRVKAVEEDRIIKISQTTQQNALWHLDRIDQRALPFDTLYH